MQIHPLTVSAQSLSKVFVTMVLPPKSDQSYTKIAPSFPEYSTASSKFGVQYIPGPNSLLTVDEYITAFVMNARRGYNVRIPRYKKYCWLRLVFNGLRILA